MRTKLKYWDRLSVDGFELRFVRHLENNYIEVVGILGELEVIHLDDIDKVLS